MQYSALSWGVGAGVPLVKGSAEPDNHTQCAGACICSTQAQPKSAGVKMPVVHTKWWKCRQIIFWRVSIFPNFVNSARIQISLAFLSFIMLSMEFYKSLKMNDENCFLWSTEHPEAPKKCLYNTTTTLIFPKKQIGKTNSHYWYRTWEKFFYDVCGDLQMSWPVKPISYKLQARCHSSPCSQVCKMVPDDFVKMTPWIIKINFASNKFLSKSLRWALGWAEICYHTRKYHLQMWYLHIVLETFLKQFSNKCNLFHIIIIKFFKGVHLFFNFFIW